MAKKSQNLRTYFQETSGNIQVSAVLAHPGRAFEAAYLECDVSSSAPPQGSVLRSTHCPLLEGTATPTFLPMYGTHSNSLVVVMATSSILPNPAAALPNV